MYSSLKGLTSGGGTSSIKRSFPVAPGESIEKDDVVTVFDNMLYRNAEMPVDALPRFSPDVLYLNNEEYSKVIHPISGNSYLYIGTTQKVISIYRIESDISRMFVSAVQKLPIYGVEGINQFQFKPLTEDKGILCYLESNTSLWTMLTIRWNDSGLQLGEPSRMELYSSMLPSIEGLSDNKLLLVWHCTKAAPWRLKASVCNIGPNDKISLEGDATEIDAAANLYSEFAFSRLSAGMFAASYWVKESDTKGSLFTRVVTWNGERLAVGTDKSVIVTAGSWQIELKHRVLSSVHFILSLKLDTTLTFHPITLREAANIPVNGGSSAGNVTDAYYDTVKISEKRFVTAVSNKASGALALTLFDTTDGNITQIAGKAVLSTVKSSYNRLTLTDVGQSLFVLTFNHEPEPGYAYTQAIMFKMAPDQNVIDDLNVKEQLINIWDRGADAYSFAYCQHAAASGFIAAGQGRLKLFRCGWSPSRFISSGVGEFHTATGDHNSLITRSVASIALSNGYVVVAYRERDTWHGKLSILQPFEGSYKPIQSYTFSYSHVDNLSIAELTPGVIVLQYKQRITPLYDSKQMNTGSAFEEFKLLTGSITGTGLSGKSTTGLNLSESYMKGQIIKLGNGYLLHVGVNSSFAVTARVIRFLVNDAGVTFTPLDQVEYLDYQRMNASAILIGPSLAVIHTDMKMIVAEVGDNGLLFKLADKYFELVDRTTRGLIADGRSGFIQVTTHNVNGELLELTPYRFAGSKLFQYADTRSVNRKTLDVKVGAGVDGKAALFYQARWDSGRSPSLSDPHQTMYLALLDIENDSEDRHYPFPCSEGTQPVFLPLDSQRYFCIGADPDGNQIYMTTYSNGEKISYGKPSLTSLGVAVANGVSEKYVEVAIRGIAEIDSPLRAGSTYYNGRDGKLSLTPTGISVGLAISDNELLME